MIKMGTTWNINICIDNAPEKRVAKLEKEIEDFILSLEGFEFYELVIDKIQGDRNNNLRYN